MKISVITVCYNSAETIGDTLRSVTGQEYDELEYVVVDGKSTDNTLSILEESRPHISVLISEKDKGLYDAMNKGIKRATGDVIGILNSDDVYQDNQVLAEVARVFNSEDVDAVYGDLVYVDRNDLSKIKRYWKAGDYRRGKFLSGWMPPHPTFFVKRKIYEQYGLFNTELRSAADYEIMLRFMHRHDIRVEYLPRIITRMRAGGMSNQTFGHRIKANLEDRKAWAINGLKPYPWTLFMKPVSKLRQYIMRPKLISPT